MSGIEPQKKTRFSRLLGGSKREKSPPEHPAAFTDSAYASSDITTPGTVNPVDRPNDVPNDAIIPAEKDSEIANIDKDRNLGMKPSTGEVFDRDTGEVVTVVTTTTTTTTTTTRKPGSKKPNVHKDVHTDVQEHTQNQPAINTANADAGTVDPNSDQSGIIAEMPATPATPGETVHTGHNLPLAAPPGEASKLLKQSPDIPARNANRRSGEYAHNPTASNNNNNNNNYNTSSTFVPQAHASDVSPEGSYFPTGNTPPLSPTRGANYSYPTHHTGREPQESTSHIPTQHQPLTHQNSTLTHQSSTRSTLSDLRAAAKGLHGVGETLRGTLNTTIDQNFPRKDPKKVAFASAKNEATLARGRDEVSSIPSRSNTNQVHSEPYYTDSNRPPPIPQHQPPSSAGGGLGGHGTSGTLDGGPVRTTTAEHHGGLSGSQWSGEEEGYGGHQQGGYGQQGGYTAGVTSGGTAEQERERKGGIGKLFKRKPVTGAERGAQGDLRDRKYY